MKMALAVLLVVSSSFTNAQIQLSGIFDVEFLKAGDESAFARNEVYNGRPNFIAHRFQLFLDAELEDDISFTAKLQNNVIFGDRIKELEVQLAYVSFHDVASSGLDLSLGRILTPFGLFARRQLSADNPLMGSPLYFYYQSRVSPSLGYRPDLTAGDPYGGLSTMYHGGYYTGAELYGSLGSLPITFDVAVTNSPLALYTPDLNASKSLSFMGRVEFDPAMFLRMGFSASVGPFMDEQLGGFRAIVTDSAAANLGRYGQTTYGIDVVFDWGYYLVSWEYVANRWNAPFIVTTTYPYSSGIPYGTDLPLKSVEHVLEAKIDVPWVVGLFLAGRYDILEFGTIDDPLNPGTNIRWDNTARRTTAGLGYRVGRRVIAKVNYDWVRIDITPRPFLDRWGMQVSVSF